MDKIKLSDDTWQLNYKSRYEMNSNLLRIVSDDSLNFFNFDDLIKWHTLRFPNVEKFNWYDGFFLKRNEINWNNLDNLRNEELKIKNFFEDNFAKSLIITSNDTPENSRKHEFAHWMYDSFEGYKRETDQLLEDVSSLSKKLIFNKLNEFGYENKYFLDEAQAYLLSDPNYFKNKFNSKEIKSLNKKISTIFDKYYFNL